MGFKNIISITTLLSCFNLNAQPVIKDGSKAFNTSGKNISYELYPHDILKVTVHVADKKNEQISNAVLLKPSKIWALKEVLSEGYSYKWPQSKWTVEHTYKTIFANNNYKIDLLDAFANDTERGFDLSLQADEKLFGTGGRSLPLNRRGYKLALYNNPWYGYDLNADALNYSMPFIFSSNGYGIFFDNPSKGSLDLGKEDIQKIKYRVTSGALEFYIIPGNSPEEIITKFAKLVGTQNLPPRWALGSFMTRFGYTSTKQMKEIYAKMEQENVPFDAVIFDLFWFGDSIKGTMGNLDWINKKAWPNPKQMLADIKKDGRKSILITEPFLLKSSATFNESKPYHAVDVNGKPFLLTDFYFGNSGLLDMFKKDAQKWFWSKYKKQMLNGADGWWGDLGEPEKHPQGLYHNLKDLGFKRLFTADEVHNMYGHYWSKMVYENFTKDYPGKRLFHLNRSGYAGTGRYSSYPWTGDVNRNWNGLKAQLPLLQGLSISGVPYIHSDAGGFAMGKPGGDGELYTRWLQMAVFTPIFRPHGTMLTGVDDNANSTPSEPALWPEPYLSIARKAVNLRYNLLPYNYTLAYQQTVYGKPLIRPMFFEDVTDEQLFLATNQYMWGDNILVSPVLDEAATEQKVYIPKKNDWYNFNTTEKATGGQWLTVNLSKENIPVFIKEGSFIPMWQPAETIASTAFYKASQLNIYYLPSEKPTTYTLYNDDGENANAIAENKYELIEFKGISTAQKIEITISPKPAKNYKAGSATYKIFMPPAFKNWKELRINGINSNVLNKDFITIDIGMKPVKIEVRY